MFVFGSGVLMGIPSTGTPINFGLVQEVSLDFAITNKPLFGQNRFPVAIGQGTTKISGKAKVAKLSGLAIGQLFFGLTPAAGSTISKMANRMPMPRLSPSRRRAREPLSRISASSTARPGCR